MARKQPHEARDDQNLPLDDEEMDIVEHNEDGDELDDEDIDLDDLDFEDLEEATASAQTLRPGQGSGGTESKAHVLSTFTQLLAQLGVEDLSNIFHKVQAVYGPGRVPGGVDMAAKNRGTVAAQPSAAVGKGAWKEDVDAMFPGEDLTEEMRERVETVFEAALNTRWTLKEAELQEQFNARAEELEEEFETALNEEVVKIHEDMTVKLDQYMDYVVEQWLEENAIAIENSLRAEIAENFISALRDTFAEHYIEVPEDRLDLMAEMRAENEQLKAQLNETLDEKLALEAIVEEAHVEAAIEEVSEGLAETQIEKLRTLAEGIEFTDPDSYRKKLGIVKEQYFKSAPKASSTGLITESIDGDDNSEGGTTGFTAPGMDLYVKAVAKSSK